MKKSCDNCGKFNKCRYGNGLWPCHNLSAWGPIEATESPTPSGQAEFDLLSCAKYHDQRQTANNIVKLEAIQGFLTSDEEAAKTMAEIYDENADKHKKWAKMLRDLAAI